MIKVNENLALKTQTNYNKPCGFTASYFLVNMGDRTSKKVKKRILATVIVNPTSWESKIVNRQGLERTPSQQ